MSSGSEPTFWAALGAIGGMMAGIAAFAPMAARGARGFWAWLSRPFKKDVEAAYRPPPVASRWTRILAIAALLTLVVAGVGMLGYLQGPYDYVSRLFRGAPPSEIVDSGPAPPDDPCANVLEATDANIVGRWTGDVGRAHHQRWDIFANHAITFGQAKGTWTKAGNAFDASFEGGSRFEGKLIGKTLCGLRYGTGSAPVGAFSLTRTSYKLPAQPEADIAPDPAPSDTPSPSETVIGNIHL